MAAVRPDQDRGRHSPGLPVAVSHRCPNDAAVRGEQELFEADTVSNFGARAARRVNQNLVEHGAPWREQRIDPLAGFDIDVDALIAIVEAGAPPTAGAPDLRT